MRKGVEVFVSYRRTGGREVARNVTERLSLKGINTFFDYDSLRDGKFNDQIFEAIDQCNDFILILSENALDRCINPDDWVRHEILYAIEKKKHIILLVVEGFVDFPAIFPEELNELRSIQFHYLDNRFYEESIKNLIGDLYAFRYKKKVIRTVVSLSILGLLLLGLGGMLFDNGKESITADVCLLRMPELERTLGYPMEDVLDDTYQYISRYDSLGRMVVLPVYNDLDSLYSQMTYYNPVFKLVLKNRGSKTHVFDYAEININNMREVFLEWDNSQGEDRCNLTALNVDVKQRIDNYRLDVSKSSDNLPIKYFLRELVGDEYDDDFIFSIECDRSCEFDMAIKVKTINGVVISTNECRVLYFKPSEGLKLPFYE